MNAFALLILVGGPYRIYQLCKRGNFNKPLRKIHFAKIFCCVVLTLAPLVASMFMIIYDTWYWYQLGSNIRDLICWGIALVVICLEFKAGVKHSRVMLLWWVLYYVFICFILQALRVHQSHNYHAYDYFDGVLRFAFAAIMVHLGLWVREGVEEEERQRLIEKESRIFGTQALLEVEGTSNPYEAANIFSRIFVWWPSSLMAQGKKRPLDFSDLWQLPKEDSAETCVAKLEQNWFVELEKPKPSLFRAFWAVHGRTYMMAAFGKLLQDIGTMSGPVLLFFIIVFFEDKGAHISMGLVWVAAVFVSLELQSLGSNYSLFLTTRISNQVRSAITGIVYRKAVRISSAGKAKFSTGQIQNLQSIDANRIAITITLCQLMWSAPLQIFVALVLLFFYLGWAAFAALGMITIIIPSSFAVAGKMSGFQKRLVSVRDTRIRVMSEMLFGIRLVKFFNWENFIAKRVLTSRDEEIHQQKKSAYAGAVLNFILSNAPLLIAVATFSAFVLSGEKMNPEIAFTSLSLIYTLRVPLGLIPLVISGLVESKLSLRRIQDFLMAEDMDTSAIDKVPLPEKEAIRVTNASFRWSKIASSDTLTDITFSVKQGELLAVVGAVGSGKSSLLEALLGELHKSSGKVSVNGSIAYVPQQAWMQNATLRANILFGKQYSDSKYRQCIDCCELMPDIAMLANKDMTEIGEKGINLSGGQKQRISLARAMYQDASIYLLDSPLSAVDAHVGSAIFENLIVGALAHTARIFVTHQLNILPRVDKIIVMHEGRIAEMGSYYELVAAGKYFAEIVTKYMTEQESQEKPEDQGNGKPTQQSTNGQAAAAQPKEGAGKIIEKEEKKEGAISWKVYREYFRSAGYGIVFFMILFKIIESLSFITADSWLAVWAQSETGTGAKMYIYIGIVGAACLIALGSTSIFVYTTIKAAKTLHNMMLNTILRVPMAFFDATPIGRIINRFSNDQSSVDATFPNALAPFISTSIKMISVVTVIVVVTPLFLVPLLPIVYVLYYLHQYYMTSSREVKRLDSISKSPIYALFSETLNGLTTIRSFEMLPAFISDNNYKIDRNMKALFVVNAITRWFTIRLELLTSFTISLEVLFCILLRETIPSAMAGLALSYALQLAVPLNYLVRQATDVETNVISVERLVEYTDLPKEGSHEISEVSVPNDWPSEGEIRFQDLDVRYRQGLDLALRGLTITINPREKIGVVGRTGAGKSSMLLALFRMVEADRGAIYIDKINIAKIGLSTLRSRLAIIPQDPVLFTGTIRSNLDPFNQYHDAEIWDVLESIQMKSVIEKLPEKLESVIVENGDNFSVGQRQLFCLGRALLRKAKILLMDEATASVDVETDFLIQQTIREKCKDVTVLTIAHRINTIMDSDRVMVLDKGKIAEFDAPTTLAHDPKSIFHSLLHESKKNVNKKSV
eukprot:Phypoly_transcript_00568.p1 GENE.Phypoly_transcript_00568~~Phypoly_transcript_00568.p1  ORF type:complete len:1446 (+),score=231.52 Phypoly_transcript_00568:83-4339(+)